MKNYYKYLPISQTEKDWGFYITTAGYTLTKPEQSYPPLRGHPTSHTFTWNKGRILNGYYLVFIARGEGVFESALTAPRVISAGNCFLLFPNIWHRYKPNLSTGWEEFWVGFNGPYSKILMSEKNFFNPNNPFINIGLNEKLLILFHRLLETIQIADPGYHQIISGVTLEMLALIHSILTYKKISDDPDIQLINKSMFLIRESLSDSLDIKKLIKELPMGYSKFRKLFKIQTGYSPHQYQLNLRINKAKYLLQTTNLNIREISFQTGFDSEFYFSRLFKNKTGASPTLFRQQNKNTSK